MRSPTSRWLLVPLLLFLALLLVACGGTTTSRFDDAQTSKGPAVAKEALPGDAFNKFFPKPEGDYDVVYTQEKKGFAEAKLKKGGKDLATLAIFDTVSNPEAAEKYKDSTEKFGDYPIIEIGSKGTGILVADRFQVQIRSTDDSFSKFDREDWFKKFNLDGLAKLK